MGVAKPERGRRVAVFEDFSQVNGRMVLAGEDGRVEVLRKSAEPTWAEPGTL
jgi:hypothetical protein